MNLGALIFRDEEGTYELNYVTEYKLNTSIPETSAAAETQKQNKMKIILKIPIDNFEDEEVQNFIDWSELPNYAEGRYKELSLYIKKPDGYEKSVVFTHASILMKQSADIINEDCVTLKVYVSQKRDKTGGVACGQSLYMTRQEAWNNLDNERSDFDDFEGILADNTGADNAWQAESFDIGLLGEEEGRQQKPDKTVAPSLYDDPQPSTSGHVPKKAVNKNKTDTPSLHDDPEPSTSGHVPKKSVNKNKTDTPSLHDDPKPSTSGHVPKKAVKKNKTNTPSLHDDPEPSTSGHVPKKSVNKNKTDTPSLHDDPKPSTSGHVPKKAAEQKTDKKRQEKIEKAEIELLELKNQYNHYKMLKAHETPEMCIARLEAKRKLQNQKMRVHRMKNPHKSKKRKSEYYQKNKEKIKERGSEYRLNNRDKIKERNSKYYQENKDILDEKHRNYARNNREKINAKRRQNRLANQSREVNTSSESQSE